MCPQLSNCFGKLAAPHTLFRSRLGEKCLVCGINSDELHFERWSCLHSFKRKDAFWSYVIQEQPVELRRVVQLTWEDAFNVEVVRSMWEVHLTVHGSGNFSRVHGSGNFSRVHGFGNFSRVHGSGNFSRVHGSGTRVHGSGNFTMAISRSGNLQKWQPARPGRRPARPGRRSARPG